MRARGAKVDRHRGDRGRRRRRRQAADRRGDRPREGGRRADHRRGQQDRQGGRATPTRVRTEMTQRGLQPVGVGRRDRVRRRLGQDARRASTTCSRRSWSSPSSRSSRPTRTPRRPAWSSSPSSTRAAARSSRVLIQRGTLQRRRRARRRRPLGPRARDARLHAASASTEARPGDPVEVLGFDGVPEAGEFVRVVENDRTRARRWPPSAPTASRPRQQARRSGRKVSLEDVFKRRPRGASSRSSTLVLKGDVAGSLEALEDEIAQAAAGRGRRSTSSTPASAASTSPTSCSPPRPTRSSSASTSARSATPRAARRPRGRRDPHLLGHLPALDELRAAMQGMLEPEEVEETVGQVEVRQIFRASRIGTIAGSYVTDGTSRRGAKVRARARRHGRLRRRRSPRCGASTTTCARSRAASSAASCSRTSRTSRRATSWRSTRRARSSASSP